MPRMTAPDVIAAKGERKLAMLTAYDYAAARLAEAAGMDMDPRLPESLSGAPDFVKTVAPRIFVPMHLGGHVEYLTRFADRLAGPKTTVFRYTAPGDTMIAAADPASPDLPFYKAVLAYEGDKNPKAAMETYR